MHLLKIGDAVCRQHVCLTRELLPGQAQRRTAAQRVESHQPQLREGSCRNAITGFFTFRHSRCESCKLRESRGDLASQSVCLSAPKSASCRIPKLPKHIRIDGPGLLDLSDFDFGSRRASAPKPSDVALVADFSGGNCILKAKLEALKLHIKRGCSSMKPESLGRCGFLDVSMSGGFPWHLICG